LFTLRKKFLPYIFIVFHIPSVMSMEIVDDEELRLYDGQAFITIDATSYNQGVGDFSGDYEFTKVNFGFDIETLVNADELRIGEFPREYSDGDVGALEYYENPNFNEGDVDSKRYLPGTDSEGNVLIPDADIIIRNFGLGRVDDYNGSDPTIVPFKIKDPYIELAYKLDGQGIRRVVGFRYGFGAAKGDFSGDLMSITGNLEGEIRGPASVALEQLDCTQEWFFCIAAGIDSDLEIYGPVVFIDPETGEGAREGTYIKRATWMGVAEGAELTTSQDFLGLFPGDWLVEFLSSSENCKTFGLAGCFRLSSYQSIYIGDPTTDDFEAGAAKGAFISLQAESVPWQDYSGLSDGRILAEKGAYLNIARFKDAAGNTRYPILLDLYNALTGEPRVATCIGRTKGC